MTPTQSDRDPCPGCGGRGFTVSLGSMLPCGRCGGTGRIDPLQEAIAERRRDEEFQARIRRNVEEHADILERLSDA